MRTHNEIEKPSIVYLDAEIKYIFLSIKEKETMEQTYYRRINRKYGKEI